MSDEPVVAYAVPARRLARVLPVPPEVAGAERVDPFPAAVDPGPDPAGPDPAGAEPPGVAPTGADLDGDPPVDATAAGGSERAGALARLGGAAAFDPGRPGLRALVAVAVLVALVAGGLAWWSRPRPEPVPPALAATLAPSPPPAPERSAEPAEVVVAVSGMVHEPGLVRLPAGARVADAIDAAGGVLPDADLDHLNLARVVTDGELITVGIPPPPGDPTAPGTDTGAPGPGAPVNLNTAGQAELETLPGIGPALAQRIIDYRATHGPFTAVDQLRQVSGIGEVRFADLRDLVTV